MNLSQHSSLRRWRGMSPLLFSAQRCIQKTLKQLPTIQLQGKLSWLLALIAIAAMWMWNWQLFLSTGVGISAMVVAYLARDWHWQTHLSNIRQFLAGPHQHIIVAVSSGGVATLSTYIATSVWLNSSSNWVATGTILQGLGTISILFLLLWNLRQTQVTSDQTLFNAMLTDLTAADPLKRLIAVRQLNRLVTNNRFQQSDRVTLTESFRLLLDREAETAVQDAVWEGLQILSTDRTLNRNRFAERPLVQHRSIAATHKRCRKRSAAIPYQRSSDN